MPTMPTDEAEDRTLGLSEILSILRARWRWLVAPVIIVPALALMFSLQQPPSYRASARVLVRTVASESLVGPDPNALVAFFADRQVKNEVQIIESSDLRRAFESSYVGGLDVSTIEAVLLEEGSDVIEVSVVAPDPFAAADLVNDYIAAYVEARQAEKVDALLAAGVEIQTRVDELNRRRADLLAPLDALDALLVDDPDDADLLQQREVVSGRIAADLASLDGQRAFFAQQMENLQLTTGLAQAEAARVLTDAEAPGVPISPKPVRDGVIGLMLGLGIGFALALAREFLDESIRTREDLARVVGSLPSLAVIPDHGGEDDTEIITITHPLSSAAEAYRALRTSVRFAGIERSMKVLQVTSPAAGAGKTTVVSNLAVSLAQAGHRVVIVCCDLRQPRVHTLFDQQLSPGLTDVVLGECLLADAVRPANGGVFVLSAGSRPPNPSELLGSGRTERVIAALAEEMDYVLLDTPPVLPVTDALVVSAFADAVLVVVSARETSRHQVRRALDALSLASAPVRGVVLTKAALSDLEKYDYGYGKRSYGEPSPSEEKTTPADAPTVNV